MRLQFLSPLPHSAWVRVPIELSDDPGHGAASRGDGSSPRSSDHWIFLNRPGYAGARKRSRQRRLDTLFGIGNHRTFHVWEGRILDRAGACLLYEEAYFRHVSANPSELEWLVGNHCQVVDNALTNVDSGFDYAVQEAESTHLQDIAIRRVLLRLGRWFTGDAVLQVRGRKTTGYRLNPGRVPFHRPEMIVQPGIEGWWDEGSVEDFWQSNKVVAITPEGLLSAIETCRELPEFQSLYLRHEGLQPLSMPFRRRSLVFSPQDGLGTVRGGSGGSSTPHVVFQRSGKKRELTLGDAASTAGLLDAEPLRGALATLQAGEALSAADTAIFQPRLSPLPPTGKTGEAVCLSSPSGDALATSFHRQLVRGGGDPDMSELIGEMLERGAATVSAGRSGEGKAEETISSWFEPLRPTVEYLAATGHWAALAVLGRFLRCDLQRAWYFGGHNPEGYVSVRLPVHELIEDRLARLFGEYVGRRGGGARDHRPKAPEEQPS